MFDAEMNRFRLDCFPQEYSSDDSRDQFDDRSTHVAARVDGLLAAYGRLSPGPHGWFEFDTRGEVHLPYGPDVIDFGRIVVAKTHRGRGHELFELILIDGLLLATDTGFKRVVGGYRKDRGFVPLIHDFGFQECGPVFQRAIAPAHERYQLVVATTEDNKDRWAACKLAVLDRLRAKGYDIVDRGCPVQS